MTKRYVFRKPTAPASEKVPRVARLLALAHRFQEMLDSGEVESMAELARLARVSRARITQIMDLMMLAPEIQEEILFGRVRVPLRDTMRVARCLHWEAQHEIRSTLVGPHKNAA